MEDTAPRYSGDRTLCPNRWTVRRASVHWAVFQEELWDGVLEGVA